MSRTEQDTVIFVGIQRAYEPLVDVVVRFQRGSGLLAGATPEDWIGLFRVGWTSVREQVASVLVPKPAPNQTESKVTLPASKIPAGGGRFYQFCYVTKDGAVVGASAPFQFTLPRKEAGTEGKAKEATADPPLQAAITDHKECKALLQEKDKIIEDVRLTVASLSDQVTEKTSLLNEKDSKLSTCQETSVQLQGLLGVEAEKNKRLVASVSEWEQRYKVTVKRTEALEGELKSAREENSDLRAALEDQRERLRLAVATHQEQLNALKEDDRRRTAEMEKQGAVLLQAREQARVLEQRLVEKESELGLANKTAEAELDRARMEKQHYEELLVRAKEENSKLEERLHHQTSELVALKNTARSAESELVSMRRELNLGQERLKASEKIIAEKQAELEKRQADRLLAQGHVVDAARGTPSPAGSGAPDSVERSVYDTLQAAYESMERHYQEAREQQEQASLKAAKMTSTVQSLESQCDELRARVNHCKKEYEAKAKECLELRRAPRVDAAEYQAKMKELEQQVKVLLENNSSISKDISIRDEIIKQQEQKIAALEDRAAELVQKYEDLKERSGLLEMQRDSLRGHVRETMCASLTSRVCPICNIEFSLGAPERDFEQHVNSHLHD